MNERKDRIRVHIAGKEYSVVGGKFQDMLGAIKQISGRRFVGELKVWQLPGTAENIQSQLELSGYWMEGGTPVAESAPSAQPAPVRAGGDRIRVLIQGHPLAVIGGSFQDMLVAVKGLPGRRFDGESKIWEIPGELAIIKQLVEAAGFQLEGADKIPLEQVQAEPVQAMETPDFGPNNEPPSFEAPEFLDNDDLPPYEPPDWLDDNNAPPPPTEPPDWWDDEMASRPPDEFSPIENESPPPVVNAPQPAQTPAPSQRSRGGDQIRIRVGGIPMVVTGGSFRQMLEVVKKIPGRRFDGNDKVWDIPGDIGLESVQQSVKAAGFVMERG